MKPNLLATLPARRADAAWGGQGPAAPAAGGETLTISQMADTFGLTPRALRFYESKGLLAPARPAAARSRISWSTLSGS